MPILRSVSFCFRIVKEKYPVNSVVVCPRNSPSFTFGTVNYFSRDVNQGTDLLVLENTIRHGNHGNDWDRDSKTSGKNRIRTSNKKGSKISYLPVSNSNITQGELIFGIYPVYYALLSGKREIYSLIIKKGIDTSPSNTVQQILSLTKDRNLPIIRYATSTLDKLVCNRPHQGICLDVSEKVYKSEDELDRLDSPNPQLWIYLQSIHDPMNLGAIIRSSYYFGVSNILVSKAMSCPLSPVVSKASAGVMELIDVYSVYNISEFISSRRLLNQNWTIIGSVASNHKNATPIEDVKLSNNAILLVGNEGSGLSSDALDLCDKCVTINSSLEENLLSSLNVSVATGVILSYLRRNSKQC